MAHLWPHKRHGFEIQYEVRYLDGTHKIRSRYAKKKSKAVMLHQDADRFEVLASKQRLTREELTYFAHTGLIQSEEIPLLSPRPEDYPSAGPLITWNTLADHARRHILRVGTKATKTGYESKIKQILAYFKPLLPEPWAITKANIEDYLTFRRRSVGKATCNKEITTLRTMLDPLVDARLMPYNLARREIKRFKAPPAVPPRAFMPHELRVFIASLEAYDGPACHGMFKEVIYTYLYTGLRREELLHLETAAVDVRSGVIRVKGKGEKTREIDLHDNLLPAFAIVNKAGGPGRYFFGGGDQPLITPDAMSRAFRKFRVKCGLPDTLTLHTLRHTWTSYMLEGGVPIHKVKEQAGHERIDTTMRYAHTIPQKERAIDKLDYQGFIDDLPDCEKVR